MSGSDDPAKDRYGTFLALSGDGIARIELDRPLDPGDPEDQQVEHLLAHSRIAECNEPFARFYGSLPAQLTGGRLADLFPAQDPAHLRGIRDFVRAHYRLEYSEEEHGQADGSLRWMSGSALGAVRDGCLGSYWLCLRDITERKRRDADRERRGHILEAVAFCAVRLLHPGTWRAHADDVVARLGSAAQAARAWIAEADDGADGSSHL